MTYRNLSLSASISGLVIVAAFPFLNYQPVGFLLENLGRYSGLAVPVAATLVVCVIGFGICRRSLSFYQIRGFGWRDLGAALFLLAALFVSVILINSLISVLVPPAALAARGDADDSSVPGIPSGYAGAIEAGICEECLYRGFVIEELGELIRSRRIAAGFSVILFGLMHASAGGGYGWSWHLLVPATAGLFLTVLYFWRGSLPLCMLVHALIDVIAVAAGS